MPRAARVSLDVAVESPIARSARVMQLESLFDVPPAERAALSWHVDLPIDERDWHVGLIVGPSGSGKTTIARAAFGSSIVAAHDWPHDRALIDAFPASLSTRDVVALLGAVGFSSPPAWLRPFHVLSNGEQFRASIARALAESHELVVVDEFTSVVDRTVAKVASHAIQKLVRASARQLVAVTCHYDVVDWLQPDWTYEPATGHFEWRSLRRHPELVIDCYPVDRSAWRMFRHHHYLSGELNASARCWGAFLRETGECIAFTSVTHFPHPKTRNIKLGHRLVVLPDYQGLGIGGRLDDWLGELLYREGYRYHNVVAHPAMIAHYARSPRWRALDSNARKRAAFGYYQLESGPNARLAGRHLKTRNLALRSFEYVPRKEKT